MRGIVFTGGRQIELKTFDDPTPGPNEVVLEMKASSMCGSDLTFYRAPKGASPLAGFGITSSGDGIIAGHEPCGVVAAVGAEVSRSQAKVGDRVMVHHYYGCAMCSHCRTGWSQMCEEVPIVAYGYTAHGGHAPYMKVPVGTLVPLPEEVSFTSGAAISCGTGTAYQALVRLDLSARDSIAIIGQGPVGLSATLIASAMGAKVIAVDVNGDRAKQALRFGAAHVIDASKSDPVEEIKALTRGKGVTRAFDASGSAAGRSAAVRASAAWGIVALVGEGGELTVNVSAHVNRKQLTILGSWTFSVKGQADCARFVADKGLAVDDLFTDYWRLDQADEAYRVFDKQTGGKAVFTF